MAGSDLITRVYSGFRGVDFRGEEINLIRSPDSLNVWKDYKEPESIRTRPETELFRSFDNTVYGVFFYKDIMLVHSGDKLYSCKDGEKIELWSSLRNAVSNSFIYDNIWYFKDGSVYLQYDGNEIKEVEGYIPTTSIARKPMSGGTLHEEVNMLQPIRINTFLADGANNEFWLDTTNLNTTNIDADYPPIVKFEGEILPEIDYEKPEAVNGQGETQYHKNYRVDYDNGKIIFTDIPSAPLTDGQDNISVQFKKTIPEYRNSILNCTLLQVFDNRVFFSGNPDHPNMVWHTSLNDPSYCGDQDFYPEGLDTAAVKGMVAGNNALWVFREPSDSNTTIFYHTPTIDSEYGKIYPNTHSSVTTGCIGKAINFNDDIVFFSERGMEGISGDVTTEQVLGHRSTLVDPKMTALSDYENMLLEEWEGYLLVFIGNKVFLADSRGVFTNENHIEYEWFYWELNHAVTCTRVYDGVLYLGTKDGVYTLTDTKSAVESYWVTPKDKFKYPQYLKTTNKRGCVVEASGDISVYVKTEKSDFEHIGEYKEITDYFVSRIKRKKFKDIQLKFYSKTRFSLETATLECFVGGYIKR